MSSDFQITVKKYGRNKNTSIKISRQSLLKKNSGSNMADYNSNSNYKFWTILLVLRNF